MANLFGRKGFLGLVSIVLTLCLCVGMLVAIPTTVAAEGDVQVWDGSKPAYSTDLFTNGDGTEGNPFLVTTAAQLYAITVSGDSSEGKYYELMNDIYLNGDYANYNSWSLGTNSTDSKGNALNLWSSSRNNIFKGKFNGNGYTVYGIAASGANAQGLFPAVASTVTIENLTVDSFYTVPWTRGGGVVGCVENGTLTLNNIVVKNGKMSGIQVKGSVGGIVGTNENTGIVNISNSAVYNIQYSDDNGTLGLSQIAHTGYGGIVGFPAQASTGSKNGFFETHAQRLSVKNSYSVDVTVEGENCYPIGIGIWGANTASVTATVNNVYTDTVMPIYDYNSLKYNLICSTDGKTAATENPIKIISTENIKGNAAKTAMPALDWVLSWSTVENGYPIPANKAWDGTTATIATAGFGEGQDGSADAPYEITNGKQLYAAVTSNAGYSFVLKNDIYLNKDYKNYDKWAYGNSSGTDSENKALNAWVVGANSTFSGTIDGVGYTVYGLFGATTGGDGGLIPYISGAATISNLNVECSLVRCGTRTGILVGRINSTAKTPEGTTYYPPVSIENVTINKGRLEGLNTAGWNGAMVGYLIAGKTTIDNCAVTNVTFGSGNPWNSTNYAEYASFGAFVGANIAGTTYATGSNEAAATYSTGNASNLVVKNSYSFNVTNDIATESYNIYPVGIQLYYDSTHSNPYQHKVSATISNVYTDATLKSFSINNEEPVCIQIGDINDTTKVVEDYSTVVKTIDSDNMKGLLDSGAWYTAKLSEVSADNLPRLRSNITRFTYADINGDGIDAAYTAADILPVREYLLGTTEYGFIDGDANASGAIDIRDLVNVFNTLK